MQTKNKVVIVTGTGRCGTSAVAGILHKLGVHMGDQFIPGNETNPAGTFEDKDFAALQQQFLRGHITEEDFKEKVTKLIKEKDKHDGVWGWKMPNTSQLLYLYKDLLPKAYYIWCRRDKTEVLDSLQNAYGWDQSRAKKLYDIRAPQFAEHKKDLERTFELEWKNVLAKPRRVVMQLINFVGLKNFSNNIDEAVKHVKTPEQMQNLKTISQQIQKQEVLKQQDNIETGFNNMPQQMSSGPRVLVGLPCGSGYFPWQTVERLLGMRKPPMTAMQIVPRMGVHKARNFICNQAMQQGASHVFFVDDDNPIPVDALEKMLKHDKDIVTCPILQRGGDHSICLLDAEEQTADNGDVVPMYEFKDKLDTSGGELIQVDATGMGCCLIKIEVIQKLMKKYEGRPFDFIQTQFGEQTRYLGEDVAFSERATQEGFEIWADTTIRPIHLGDPREIVFTDNLIE
jgi:hypothetical protein